MGLWDGPFRWLMSWEEGEVFLQVQGLGGALYGPEAMASPEMSALSPRLQIRVPWQKFLLFSPSGQVRGTLEFSTVWGGKGREA